MSASRLHIAAGSAVRLATADEPLHATMRSVALAVSGLVARGMALGHAVGAVLRAAPAVGRVIAFDPAVGGASFGLCPELLYPGEPHPIDAFQFGRGASFETTAVGELPASEVARLLELCASGRHREADLRGAVEGPLAALLDRLLAAGVVGPVEPPRVALPPRGVPCLVRLQHASVLIQSATTAILVDPHLHSSYEPALERSLARSDLEGRVDAVLLSHSHGDHYDLATLAMLPRDLPIVVPRVPRGNLLCEDMAARLRSLGFRRVLDPPWYAPAIEVGDVEVHPLPFHGEQPLVDGPLREPELRNWGNTYLVRTPQASSWLLVDSGNDVSGRAVEVAAHVRATWGPIDLVLSNLREFGAFTPLYVTGAGQFWFALPPALLEEFESLAGSSVTLGPAGVAEVCAVAGARRFLPYAHWWAEPGQRGPGEVELVGRLAQELARRAAPTEIHPWAIGDAARLDWAGVG
jgi:L-ascorbate metabolism protein UlaG (beta-lactamase superfamily)